MSPSTQTTELEQAYRAAQAASDAAYVALTTARQTGQPRAEVNRLGDAHWATVDAVHEALDAWDAAI